MVHESYSQMGCVLSQTCRAILITVISWGRGYRQTRTRCTDGLHGQGPSPRREWIAPSTTFPNLITIISAYKLQHRFYPRRGLLLCFLLSPPSHLISPMASSRRPSAAILDSPVMTNARRGSALERRQSEMSSRRPSIDPSRLVPMDKFSAFS